MGKEEKNTYSRQNERITGEIKIADDVVASIAAHAASETEGVASTAGSLTNEHSTRLGRKNLLRRVKVEVTGGVVTVSVAVKIKYNYNIIEVSAKVQEKVKNAIESMTGLKVADVNVNVAGIDMGLPEQPE